MKYTPETNPLAAKRISQLLMKFAIPSIISFLVSGLYNIVDQIFIGQSVGLLGNAATNVAFPIATVCTATGLLFGIGGASNFNLNLGAGKKETAAHMAGNALFYLLFSGCIIAILVALFRHPLLIAFGASKQVLPYALTYTQITCIGIPFVILSVGGGHLIRADGSPAFSMVCMLSGAIVNMILDPILIFGFQMGMAGAAIATVIGQAISAALIIFYFTKRLKTFKLSREYLTPEPVYLKAIASLGMAACFNQLAMLLVQVTLNNSLTYYGARSHYGEDIPLACVGVITKVNTILLAFMIGISQGCQPIIGFNYGAENYKRVKKTYLTGASVVTIISTAFFIAFQLIPRQLVSIFGSGTEEYFEFAVRYFRIFLALTFINGIQPLTANFFSSIGHAKIGIVISLTRQILFLLPLILVLPLVFGIDGIMYAGPVADTAAAVLSILFVRREFTKMNKLEKEKTLA